MHLRTSSLRSCLVLVAALLVAPEANAETGLLAGIFGFVGYQGHAMDDINQRVIAVNEALSAAGSRVAVDELQGNLSFGGGLVIDVDRTWRLSAEYESLSDDTSGGNEVGNVSIDVSSNAYLFGVTYFLPSTGKTRFGLGAGAGYYENEGEGASSGTIGGTPFSQSFSGKGSTIGLHARADLEIAMTDEFRLGLGLGYRLASGELEANGVGTGVDTEWSGIMSRVSLMYIGPLDF